MDVQTPAADLLDGFGDLDAVQQLDRYVGRGVVKTAVQHLCNLPADRFREGVNQGGAGF